MGVARNLEQRLEGLVEGFFTKIFRSGLQPVEIGRRIQREMTEGRTISVNRIYAPNEFHVYLGPEDHSRYESMIPELRREFSDLIIEVAKENRWNLMGAPRIEFVLLGELGKGEFRVEASLAADAGGDAPRASTRSPDEGDPSATRAIATDTAARYNIGGTGARLSILDEDGKSKESISLTGDRVTIGRLSSNDIILSDPNVSRRHAELRREAAGWMVVDLGSTNGTLVNGKLAKEHRLEDGDRLTLGQSDLVFSSAPGGS